MGCRTYAGLTLKAGNSRSWSLVRSSQSLTVILVFGSVNVDILAMVGRR